MSGMANQWSHGALAGEAVDPKRDLQRGDAVVEPEAKR